MSKTGEVPEGKQESARGHGGFSGFMDDLKDKLSESKLHDAKVALIHKKYVPAMPPSSECCCCCWAKEENTAKANMTYSQDIKSESLVIWYVNFTLCPVFFSLKK